MLDSGVGVCLELNNFIKTQDAQNLPKYLQMMIKKNTRDIPK